MLVVFVKRFYLQSLSLRIYRYEYLHEKNWKKGSNRSVRSYGFGSLFLYTMEVKDYENNSPPNLG